MIDEKDVIAYLHQHIEQTNWHIATPQRGFSLDKSFIGVSVHKKVFVKLGVDNRVIQLLSDANITPSYLAGGTFHETTIAIQEYVTAVHPGRAWYATHMETLAQLFHKLQGLTSLQHYLPHVEDESYQTLFVTYINQVKYEFNKAPLHHESKKIIEGLIKQYDEHLTLISGEGLTLTHGDPNSGNILITATTTYLTDWETLHLSDPIHDIAHLLWWMYRQSQWNPLLKQFNIDLSDTSQKERFYLTVSIRALYVYLLFVNARKEHLAERFLADAQRSALYEQPQTLL